MASPDAPRVDLAGLAAYFADQADVMAAYLFGSTARGEANHLSDVDIAVLLDPVVEGEAAVERQLQLMIDLDRFADREVQVLILNHAAPLLAYQVIRDGKLLFERDRAGRIAFEVRAMKLYFDLQPMLALQDRALLTRIQEAGLGKGRRSRSGALGAARRIHGRLAPTSGR
ncbi:MAG: type VII toxin-antitoxin system MntA family adenylyltransferase antitoxin [Anaerolineae bacterium]